jgi:hypothetical protein
MVAVLSLVFILSSGCSHLRPPQEGSAALGNATGLKPACEYNNWILDAWECLGEHRGQH